MTDVAPEVAALAALVGLERRAREARTARELAFVMVNETLALVPYRQAALWTGGEGVVAVSGVAVLDRDAPFLLWLEGVCRHVSPGLDRPVAFGAGSLPEGLRAEWSEWLPFHALALPLADPDGVRMGILLLARDEPWAEAETHLAEQAAGAFGVAWAWRHRPSAWSRWRKTLRRPGWKLGVVALAAACLAIPVRLSVLAPGEVVARDPAVIRSPLDGVIERVHVRPNDSVAGGQSLFELDTTSLAGRLEVARKALATALAEQEQAAQQAFTDPRAKASLGVLAGRIAERRAEAAQLEDLLARSRATAPRAGIAVLDDPSEWIGRPVAVGEKVLAIADEHDTEVEAWLAPGDLIELEAGASAVLFLNVAPLEPVTARLRYVAYEAAPRPDGSLAHRLRADIAPDEAKPRLGLKGTVRLDGRRVPLVYWLLRRPIAALRQMLGV